MVVPKDRRSFCIYWIQQLRDSSVSVAWLLLLRRFNVYPGVEPRSADGAGLAGGRRVGYAAAVDMLSGLT